MGGFQVYTGTAEARCQIDVFFLRAAQSRLYTIQASSYLFILVECIGDRGSTVVKALCYKSEGRWFDPSWCQWIFH